MSSSCGNNSPAANLSGPRSEAPLKSECYLHMDNLDSFSQKPATDLPRKTSPRKIYSTEGNEEIAKKRSMEYITKSHTTCSSTDYSKHLVAFNKKTRESSESSSSIEVISEDETSSLETSRISFSCNPIQLLDSSQSSRSSSKPLSVKALKLLPTGPSLETRSSIESLSSGSALETGYYIESLPTGSSPVKRSLPAETSFETESPIEHLPMKSLLETKSPLEPMNSSLVMESPTQPLSTGSSPESCGSSSKHAFKEVQDCSSDSSFEHL